jgi:penicillin-binding protein 2
VSFHPNEVQRRARVASAIVAGALLILLGAFFRTQVLQNARYVLASEENRLREIPLPAPRGIIYDRNGKIIAENLPGYSISLLARNEDSLRVTMQRIGALATVTPEQVGAAGGTARGRRCSSAMPRSSSSRCSRSGAWSSRG